MKSYHPRKYGKGPIKSTHDLFIRLFDFFDHAPGPLSDKHAVVLLVEDEAYLYCVYGAEGSPLKTAVTLHKRRGFASPSSWEVLSKCIDGGCLIRFGEFDLRGKSCRDIETLIRVSMARGDCLYRYVPGLFNNLPVTRARTLW